jgi:hypothetical protein
MKPVVVIFVAFAKYIDNMAKTHLTTFTAEMPKVIEAVKTARAEIIAAAFDLKLPEIGRSIGATMDKANSAWDKAGGQLGCAFDGSEFDAKSYERKAALRAARQRKIERKWADSVVETEAQKAKEAAEEVAKEEKELTELLAEEEKVGATS